MLFSERIANVDDILGEQFLSDAKPTEEDIKVDLAPLMKLVQWFDGFVHLSCRLLFVDL